MPSATSTKASFSPTPEASGDERVAVDQVATHPAGTQAPPAGDSATDKEDADSTTAAATEEHSGGTDKMAAPSQEDYEALKERVAQLESENSSMRWEGEFAAAFANSGLPERAEEHLRPLLNGVPAKDLGHTVDALTNFAQAVAPSGPPSPRPLEGLRPGASAREEKHQATWLDVLKK